MSLRTLCENRTMFYHCDTPHTTIPFIGQDDHIGTAPILLVIDVTYKTRQTTLIQL